MHQVLPTSTSLLLTIAAPNMTSSNDSNVTSLSGHRGRDEALAKVEVAVQAVILVVTVCGNGLVLVALTLRRKHLSRMNIMIVHLACADLFVAFFNVLPQLIWDVTHTFRGGDILCRPIKYLQVVAMYASSYVLVSTAIDRWLAICRPLTTHVAWSTAKTHGLVALAWTLALIFALPQLFIFSWTLMSSGSYDCWGDFDTFAWSMPAYVTAITCAIYIIPTAILAVTYTSICCAVWRSAPAGDSSRSTARRSTGNGSTCSTSTQPLLFRSKSTTSQTVTFFKVTDSEKNGGGEGHRRSRSSWRGASRTSMGGPPSPAAYLSTSGSPRPSCTLTRAKVKTVKLTLTVVTCYVVCWGPFFIVQMWRAWDSAANQMNHAAIVIITLLASLNSCANPWIFLAFSGLDTLEECCRFVTSTSTGGVPGGRGASVPITGGQGGEDIALKTRQSAAPITNGSRASYAFPVTSHADDDTVIVDRP